MLSNLNDAQRQAVLHCDTPLLILAGAGSGKTRVLSYKTIYLIKNFGIHPDEILAVTFTNKAAREMKERVYKLLNISTGNLWISTFHSACMKILRSHATKLGYTNNFIIYDDSEQKAFVKKCMDDLEIDSEMLKPKTVQQGINRARNNLSTAEELLKQGFTVFDRQIAKIFSHYQEEMKKNDTMDFGDIITNCVTLFKENPEVLKFYQDKFKYIMVDEYQDTNIAQYTLLILLAQNHRKICVVGDDDQSIYKFRGANIQNILNFEKDYKDAKIIKLEENYRSTKNILSAAHNVIQHNRSRKEKKLFTQNEEGDKIRCHRSRDELDEAKFVINDILKHNTNGSSFKDIAVFFRTNAQSRIFEEEFFKTGIPYIVVGGIKFYSRAEIKDIIAYLRIVSGVSDIISIKRIINKPKRGIGNTTFDKVESYMEKSGIDFFSAVREISATDEIRRDAKSKLLEFTNLIDGLKEYATSRGLGDVITKIYEDSTYKALLEADMTSESRDRENNITEFISGAYQFEKESPENDIHTFLDFVSLVNDTDGYDEERDSVTLITLHSAKGLEFPIVYMTGMEDGIFPHIRSLDNHEELEEERRLCYVGITRAKKQLIITHASSRRTYNSQSFQKPSRFLANIPDELLIKSGNSATSYQTKSQFSNSYKGKTLHEDPHGDDFQKYIADTYFSEEPVSPNVEAKDGGAQENSYKVGQNYQHPVFGVGKLKQIEGQRGAEKLTMYFPKAGEKKIMAKYVQLKKV